jgi:Zn-dependent protease with chaperone function
MESQVRVGLPDQEKPEMIANLYPPTVKGAPPNLTVPSSAYRRQVVIVLLSLLVFILFYLGLIAASGWAVIYTISQAINGVPDEQGGQTHDNAYIGLAICAGILLLFLVKALFKWRKEEEDVRIEITEAEHPALFAFIRQICADTHAPFPYHVYVTPEVNASVFYNNSVLSLFLPVKKNLNIGLGLVNGLNLSEFKAVLAHEFGHFSQSSMRLGSYVYVANRVIADLVYQRDGFDDLLEKAKRTNIRIAIFAWMIYAALWVLRKILQGVFHVINFFQSALSRQMEFHADLVAVSITGSDALIHALKKLDFINACLMQTFQDLKEATEHKLYTQDIYYHQTIAADYMRRTLKLPDAGKVPALPADPTEKVQLFTREEDAQSEGMWASHPSHYDREQNAKRHYIRSVEDERSPWLLFSNPEQLRQRMTEKLYRHAFDLKNPVFSSAAQLQAFIDEEHAETTQDERYLGLYDGRPLSIPTEALTDYANDPAVQTLSQPQICAVLNRLYNAEYKDWLDAHHKRREELDMLRNIERRDSKQQKTPFDFRGRKYLAANAKGLREMVEKELEADSQWLQAFDREVFQTHLRIGQILREGDSELYNRYYFHLHLQDTLKVARQEELRLMGLFAYLRDKGSTLSTADFEQCKAALQEAQRNINTTYEKTRTLLLPALQNMKAGEPLSEYLLQEALIHPMPYTDKGIDGQWVSNLGRQVSQIEERSRRLYFKSMGAILTRQEALAAHYREWIANGAATPVGSSVASERAAESVTSNLS